MGKVYRITESQAKMLINRKKLLSEYAETQPNQVNIDSNNGIRINNITYTEYRWTGSGPQYARGTFDKKIQGIDLEYSYGQVSLTDINDKNDFYFQVSINDNIGRLTLPSKLDGNTLSELIKKLNFLVGANVFSVQNTSIGQPKEKEPELNNKLVLDGANYTKFTFKDSNTQKYQSGNVNQRLNLNSDIYGILSLQSDSGKELNLSIWNGKVEVYPKSLVLRYNDMDNLIKTVNGIFNTEVLNRNNMRDHISMR